MAELLRLELTCEASSAARSRRAMRSWLRSVCGHGELCEPCDDLVFAVSEAVTNCIDHAYRGLAAGAVSVQGSLERPGDDAGTAVVVHVADGGRWRTPRREPGDRGRGLMMMRASVGEMDVQARPSGTTVTFRKRSACLSPACAGT